MINETNLLSEREREILRLVATGLSNQQIAHQLGISPNTVKVHLRNVFGKINVASRTEATMYAVRAGIVTVTDRQIALDAEPQAAPPAVIDAPDQPTEQFLSDVVQAPSAAASLDALPVIPAPDITEAPTENVPAQETDAGITVQPTVAVQGSKVRRLPIAWLGSALVLLVLLVVGAWWLPWSQAKVDTNPPLPSQPSLWTTFPELSSARAGFAITSVNDQVYIIGGESQAGVLDSVERYTVGTQSWAKLSKKPTPVADVQTVRIAGKLYVPGGRFSGNSRDVTTVLERYDPTTDRWDTLRALPAPRSGYALATLDGKLYLFGGWDGTSFRREVFEYNPDDDMWRERTSMSKSRAFAQAGVVEDSIFVIGGENEQGALTTNDVYTPSQENANPWRSRAPLPQARSRFGLAVPLREIHIFGGEPGGGGPLKYNVSANQWSEVDPSPEVVGNQPGVVQQGAMILVMGGKLGTDVYAATVQGYQALSRLYLPRQ